MENKEKDSGEGKAALEDMMSHISSIEEDDYVLIRGVEEEPAAKKFIELGKWLVQPEIRKRFETLKPAGFNPDILELIEPAAKATLFLLAELEENKLVIDDPPKLPKHLILEAMDTRARMLKLIDYYFYDHPELELFIMMVRRGHGYLDLAQDLANLSTIYKERMETIKDNERFFRPGDVESSARMSAEIYEILDIKGDEKYETLKKLFKQTWSLLIRSWDEIRSGGQFLFRKEPEELKRFISVLSFGRNRYGTYGNKPKSEEYAKEAGSVEPPIDTTP